jgi:deoxyadenosine/deoxycytidine kinase
MKQPLVGIVGPCAAGKSTLIQNLSGSGYRLKHIAQEHSYVPDMWQRLTHPDVLVFLDVSFEESSRRRPMPWREADYLEQQRRLRHARAHADFYLLTDGLTPEEVAERVKTFLKDYLGNTMSATGT